MIDGCVARLCQYKPEDYELIVSHIVIGIPLRRIAKEKVFRWYNPEEITVCFRFC